MIATAEQLIHEFEALPDAEKSVFTRIFWKHMPAIDSGNVTDEELCAAGDSLASMLDAEESYDAETR